MTAQAGAVAWRAVATENGSSPQTLWIAMPVSSWAIHDEAAGICTIEYAYTTPPAAVPVEALEGLVKLKEAYCRCDGTQEAEDAAILTILNKIDELTQLIKERSNG